MDFMKGAYRRVAETAKVVGQKTASAAETARINSKIAAINEETGKVYTQIGKEYYKAYRQGAPMDLSALCACVDEFLKQIDQLNVQLEDMSDEKRCPSCGAKQSKDIKFCPECGAKLSESPKAAANDKTESVKSADVVISWPDAQEGIASEVPANEPVEEEPVADVADEEDE